MSLVPGIDPSLVTGAWREGDPPGARLFADIGDVALDSGTTLPDVRLAYETWGTYDGTNAVLVLHALTGDSHVHGPAGPGHPTPGWWDAVVGPGLPIDTDRFFVVAANILGGCQGSTGPASPDPDGLPWGGSFPALTVRDQVRAEAALADVLGIPRWHGVVGGSAGGMRALEWAVEHPDRVERLFLLATSAAASAEQIALSRTQVAAIQNDPDWFGGDYYDGPQGPLAGLDLARRIAHIAYRSEGELEDRFGRTVQADDRWAVDSYLQHHGAKLVRRFDAGAYVVLTSAMDSHDVGRDRGGVEAALGRITARTVVAGIDSDRLYPIHQQRLLADLIPGSGPLEVVKSPFGHDGFLIEADQVGELARALLA
ncbi:homoserine O-acetyltransferase [Aeromicrobium sp. SMF47]|uniref:homoserine O-acetyltransferase MetX n=1 Tax=Aeromicrobium TaxID=2040 RepID=UPI0013C1861B|nr:MULTISPECIES: homoserine O-acetyltransferase [Aeromicrobium]MRJ75758.1 homoserine O-acetyltransferase [Aeromicrobium yanjiei]MRK00102.1 homoserine O-acetyltransferase [Aeromicrobium sp. S22]